MRNGIDCKGNCREERTLGKRAEDLTGRRFTKLIVLFPVYIQGRPSNKCYWLCQCDCGNYIVCRADCLKNQHIQSCGCMIIEGIYKKSRSIAEQMIGERFGKLRAAEFVGYKQIGVNSVGRAMFRCECDCGNNNVIVAGPSLRDGMTLSCGCLTRSIGEENIENILRDHDIYFKAEYIFCDLRSDKDGYLRYDFAILNENNAPIRLIEFDGEQHVKPVKRFGGEEKFNILKQNDNLKNQYAVSHNIPLVRLPYSLRDIMTIEDLMEDKYLISTIQN